MEEPAVLCTNCRTLVSDHIQGTKIFKQYQKTKKKRKLFLYDSNYKLYGDRAIQNL